MVWGWVWPNSFGDYFPNGDFVGWDEGIKRHFDEELSAEQRASFDNWDVAYREVVSRKFSQNLGSLAPHERPSEFRLMEKPKSLGSIINTVDRLLAVDTALHEIIERLEPGVHQFWPLRITTRTGAEYPVAFYGLVIGRYLDSFVPEQSTGLRESEGRPKTYSAIHPTKKAYSELTVSKSAVAGTHLWRELRLLSPALFFSDELQSEIARHGLRIGKCHQLKAV